MPITFFHGSIISCIVFIYRLVDDFFLHRCLYNWMMLKLSPTNTQTRHKKGESFINNTYEEHEYNTKGNGHHFLLGTSYLTLRLIKSRTRPVLNDYTAFSYWFTFHFCAWAADESIPSTKLNSRIIIYGCLSDPCLDTRYSLMLSFSCAMCRYSTDTPGNHCCIHSINSKSKKRTRLIIRSGMGIASTQSLSRVGRYNPQHSNSLSISSS